MEEKRKITIINLVLIILLVLCLAVSGILIIVTKSKEHISIIGETAEKLKNNYTTIEETSNIWDVSLNSDGSVIATLDDDGTLTISGKGSMKRWDSSDTTDWHLMSERIKTVIIENGVTSIGDYAFENCYNLKQIEISNTVTNILYYVFSHCDSLTSIAIPESVTSIYPYAFDNCSSLENIKVDEKNASYKDVNGVLYTKDGNVIVKYPEGKKDSEYTILNGVTRIKQSAFYNCGNLKKIEIPNSVTIIEDYALAYRGPFVTISEVQKNSTKVEIGSGVTSIGNYAFANRRLTEIEIPSSVTIIGDYAFNGTIITNLTSINENNKELPSILKRAQDKNDILYSNFKLTNCTIEESTLKIDKGKSYAEIYVTSGKLEGLTYIVSHNTWDVSENGDGNVMATLSEDGILTISGSGNMSDFTYSNNANWHVMNEEVKNVIIEKGVTSIGDNAFANCYNLEKIEIPSSVLNIGKATFKSCCNLENVEIPNGVTAIRSSTFEGCYKLVNVKIPSSVLKIESFAFGNCNQLENVEIPSNVIEIVGNAFEWCMSLTQIKVDENNVVYKDVNGVLYTKDGNTIIKYPSGKTENKYTILNDVKNIEIGAFSTCINLENIEIPSSALNIGEYAFRECYSLKNIVIPDSVTTIGEDVFDECYELIITCYKNSTAHTYVKENNINYLIIMDGINPKTTGTEIMQSLENVTNYEITDKNGENITEIGYVGTGTKVITEDGENYIILVTGDCNGDGHADIKDILTINKHRLNIDSLTVEYLLASDVNKDGITDIKDILQINKYRLGKISEL